MKILIYYNDITEFTHLKSIAGCVGLSFLIDETDNLTTFMTLKNKTQYDIVFIDFLAKNSVEAVETILKKNSKQKIVLLNDTYDCFDNRNCANCIKNYNMSTVVKPLSQLQIGSVLNKNFICESFKKSECEFKLEKVLKFVLEKYPFINFNKSKNYFDLSSIVNPSQTTILLELMRVLDKNSIKHYLLEDRLKIDKG